MSLTLPAEIAGNRGEVSAAGAEMGRGGRAWVATAGSGGGKWQPVRESARDCDGVQRTEKGQKNSGSIALPEFFCQPL
jgi:hypothetical protein